MSHFDIPFQDKNSERKMLYRRIERLCEDMRARIWDDSVRVYGVEYCEGQYPADALNAGDWRPFGDEEYWGSRELYCRFRQTVTIPQSFQGRTVFYAVDPQPDTGWQNSAFQFILFVNGQMLQGMDPNHPDALLTDCAKSGETFEIVLHAYCDDHSYCGQGKFHACLKTLDAVARDVYYDFAVPLEAAHAYGADDLERVEIVRVLNTAANMLELVDDADTFHASAKQASEYIHSALYGRAMPVTVSAIGHTHIDVAWLWRLRQTREKAGRSFATVLQLMREYPSYRFMSPQAQLYDYVRQDYPELYAEIKRRIQEGRWEAEGSMWVESDTNVISGESLVRQFLVGKRFFRDEFGVDNKIMWLPDVFGYSAALPQIMKLAGIDYFMTTKISWSEMDCLPFDTFKWKGIDGSEVLAHFIPSACEYDVKKGFHSTYNASMRPDYMINGWRRYSNKDLNQTWLCAYGHGDGGGGPTRFMLENGKRLREGLYGCPQVVPEFARTFFDRLASEVRDHPRLPTWQGELYLEFHRGTLTSQARNKRWNRKAELLMHDCETLSAAAHALINGAYPAEELLADWKLILLNQFHDIIPGSSIKQVYEDSKAQYTQVFQSGEAIRNAAIRALTEQMNIPEMSVVVCNTLGFERADVCCIPAPEPGYCVVDASGEALAQQITYDGQLLFFAKEIPAKGYRAFAFARKNIPDVGSAIQTDGDSVETPHFSVTFDAQQNIVRLYHKRSGRCVAPEGEVLNRLIAYEDRPNVYEAWDVKSYYDQKYWLIDDVQSAEWIECGPVRAVYRVVRNFRASVITQDFIFYAAIDRIDVHYTIDWHEKNVLLKADYPVDVNTSRATYDIQFGNIERATHENTTWDFAKFEACGHKWADLSDNGFGLSVLNDCKYGWNIKNGHIRPSILRCATKPNVDQDREMHDVTFSLYPHTGAVQDSDVVRHGYCLNVPTVCRCSEPHSGKLPAAFSLVCADADNVIVETVKKAEDNDALILRTYETWNRGTECTLRFGKAIRAAYRTDLLESRDEPLPTNGTEIHLRYKPFEIVTLKVEI